MNATAARRARSNPSLPQLPRRHRVGLVLASVLVSTVLLSSIVGGLTSAPEAQSQIAAESAETGRG